MRLNPLLLIMSLSFSALLSASVVAWDDASAPEPVPLPPRAVMDSFCFPTFPPRATIDACMPRFFAIDDTRVKLSLFKKEAARRLNGWFDNLSRDDDALFAVNIKGSYYTLLEVKTRIMASVRGLSFVHFMVVVLGKELYQSLRTDLLTKIECLIESRLGLVSPSDQILANCVVVGNDGQPRDRTKGAFIASMREALSEVVEVDDSDSEPDPSASPAGYADLPFSSGGGPSRSSNDFTSLDDLDIFGGI